MCICWTVWNTMFYFRTVTDCSAREALLIRVSASFEVQLIVIIMIIITLNHHVWGCVLFLRTPQKGENNFFPIRKSCYFYAHFHVKLKFDLKSLSNIKNLKVNGTWILLKKKKGNCKCIAKYFWIRINVSFAIPFQ